MREKTPPEEGRATLNYSRHETVARPKRTIWLLTWIAIGLLGCFYGALLFPSLFMRDRGESTRIGCASHLKQIGLAIIMYSNNDPQGRYPDSLSACFLDQDIDAPTFICPNSTDTPAIGVTRQATASSLATPGHCTYIYLGKGLTNAVSDPNIVLAYEPNIKHNDGHAGMNVLFSDSHVEFLATPGVLSWISNSPLGGPVMRPGTKPLPVPAPARSSTVP